VRSMGTRYVAWQDNKKYSGDLPAVSLTATYEDFALDAKAVVRAVAEELARAA